MNWKLVIGLALGLLIGLGCAAFDVPLPASPAMIGALMLVAMTSGYLLADRYLARKHASSIENCDGPTGRPASEKEK